MHTRKTQIQEISVLNESGADKYHVNDLPMRVLGVRDAESILGSMIVISYIADLGAISECKEVIRYYVAKSGDSLDDRPKGMYYAGQTASGSHVWTAVPGPSYAIADNE